MTTTTIFTVGGQNPRLEDRQFSDKDAAIKAAQVERRKNETDVFIREWMARGNDVFALMATFSLTDW